jgi:hypothetical protein
MPITIPLYSIIYSKDPLKDVKHIVKGLSDYEPEFLEVLTEHIRDELDNPKQRIVEFNNFACQDEDVLRDFLGQVRDGLIKAMKDKADE